MSATRNGKLVRLPGAVQDQLNRRLENGEPGNHVVDWLNALPEVQAILAAEFAGAPIQKQNLSRWKQGGYRDWQSREEALAVAGQMAAEASAAAGQGTTPLTETLTQWVAARYAVATRRIAGADDDEEAWQLLREMCEDVVQLRRRDQTAERLALDRRQEARRHSGRGQPHAIEAGLEALVEFGRRNPQAQAALEQLVAMARRTAHSKDAAPATGNSISSDA